MRRRCPSCGLMDFDAAWAAGEKPCSPLRCDAWKVIGKSKNGGPLLRLVSPTAYPPARRRDENV